MSKIKVIEISVEDCNRDNEIVSIPLYTEGIINTFTVTIEETISQDFEIVAANSKTAIEIARERYNNGSIVLENAEVHSKKMAVTNPQAEATDWIDI